MEIPDNLKYTKDHEWIKIDEGLAVIGITDYAQEQLGDIVFVELPDEGEDLKEGDTFGAVESVKAVNDCFVPVSGTVAEVNDLLQENPETINEDCYGEGWMLKIKIADEGPLSEMMDNEAYEKYVKEESA